MIFQKVKNCKIANNSGTTEAREKISTYLESLEYQKFVDKPQISSDNQAI